MALTYKLHVPGSIVVSFACDLDLEFEFQGQIAPFKISAGPQTLTRKIWVGLASFPSLSYINVGKIVLRSVLQIVFWRLKYLIC